VFSFVIPNLPCFLGVRLFISIDLIFIFKDQLFLSVIVPYFIKVGLYLFLNWPIITKDLIFIFLVFQYFFSVFKLIDWHHLISHLVLSFASKHHSKL